MTTTKELMIAYSAEENNKLKPFFSASHRGGLIQQTQLMRRMKRRQVKPRGKAWARINFLHAVALVKRMHNPRHAGKLARAEFRRVAELAYLKGWPTPVKKETAHD